LNRQDIPRDLQFAAYESSIERDKSILAQNIELSNLLHQIRGNYIREVRDILGSKFNEYQAFRQKIRERYLAIRPLLIATPEGEKVRSEFERTSAAEKREFITSLGNDFENVKKVQKKYRAQATSAVEKAMNIVEPAPYVDVKSPDFDNTWTFRTPPYDGSSGYELKDYAGFQGNSTELAVSHFEDASTAEIGCKSFIRIGMAWAHEEDPYGHTTAGSDVWVSFLMPTTGLAEVYVFLQSIETTYDGYIKDEFGFSGVEMKQESKAYLEILPPAAQAAAGDEKRYQTLLDYRKSYEHEWSSVVTWPGDYLYPHLYSMHPYAAGETVVLKIGVEDQNYVRLNDMTCFSNLTNRWFVSKVAIRSTGGL
jgi:hypothetical protein